MTLFYDKDGNGYIAQMNLTRTIDVSGNISISGTIFNGDDVLQNIGYGWSFKFQDEKYIISYTKLNDEDNTVEFDAVHKFLWDFSKSVFYESWTGSHTFEAYLSALFNGSGYTYDLQTTVAAFEKDNWGMKNKADLLSDIISAAGIELEISNLKVTIRAQIGSDLTSIARYGINLSDLIEENNISNFATHGKGFGAYYDEDDTSKGRLEVEYTSDLAETYGILDLDPIVDERYTISDNLLAAVKSGVDATFAVSVSLNMYDLENAGYPNYDSPQVGDWILAIDEKLNFKRKVRIIKLEEEFDANEKRIGYTVTAGDLSQAEQLQSAQVSAANAIQQLQQDVITVYYSANGKNRTFTGTDDPNTLGLTDLISGDIYWRTNGDKKELWIYDGTRWNQEVSDATGIEISKSVATAMAEADTAKQNANTAVETATTATNNATIAITNAQNAADVATAVQQEITTLKGGSTLTIAELENGLSTKVSSDDFNSYRTQTDAALVDKVSSSDFTSYRTQTDSAIQDRITSVDAQSMVTQASDVWNVKLTNAINTVGISNQVYNSEFKNSADGWTFSTGGYFTRTNASLYAGSPSIGGNVSGQSGYYEMASSSILPINSSETPSIGSLSAHIRIYNDSSNVSYLRLIVFFYKNTGSNIGSFYVADTVVNNSWGYFKNEGFTIPAGATRYRLVVASYGDIVHGVISQPYLVWNSSTIGPYQADSLYNATQADISVLNDNINLRVQKNDVINQINVSSEGILIDGAKVHITGLTTIDSAVIKSAMIDDLQVTGAKIADATIASAKIISIDASKITANTLSAITTNTGTLNVSGWININNANYGIQATYDYGDQIDGAFNPRWFSGSYMLGYRYMKFLADVYMVTSTNTKGQFLYYTESFFGGDYLKLRNYDNSTDKNLAGRVDVTALEFQISSSWTEGSGICLFASGESTFSANAYFGVGLTTGRIKIIPAWTTFQINENFEGGMPKLQLSSTYSGFSIQQNNSSMAEFYVGGDSSGPRIWSTAIYNRTYSGSSNVYVTDAGTLGRITSARKYKMNIKNDVSLEECMKLIDVPLATWDDKAEIALHGTSKRHFGIIAEDLEAAELNYLTYYDSNGELEGINYDRVALMLIPIVKQLQERVNELEKRGA